MKPFRIYQVVAGGIKKAKGIEDVTASGNPNRPKIIWRHDFDSLLQAEQSLDRLLSFYRHKNIFLKDSQFCIQEYSGLYNARIVKIIQ